MATHLTPLGRFVKWAVLPASLALFGYAVLAPRLMHVAPRVTKKVQTLAIPKPKQEAEDEKIYEDPAPAKKPKKTVSPPPDVSVDVKPSDDAPRVSTNEDVPALNSDPTSIDVAPEPPKRKKKHRKPKTDVPQKEEAPEEPKNDPASGGAIGDGGNNEGAPDTVD